MYNKFIMIPVLGKCLLNVYIYLVPSFVGDLSNWQVSATLRHVVLSGPGCGLRTNA
jgi:hypothetical protein